MSHSQEEIAGRRTKKRKGGILLVQENGEYFFVIYDFFVIHYQTFHLKQKMDNICNNDFNFFQTFFSSSCRRTGWNCRNHRAAEQISRFRTCREQIARFKTCREQIAGFKTCQLGDLIRYLLFINILEMEKPCSFLFPILH